MYLWHSLWSLCERLCRQISAWGTRMEWSSSVVPTACRERLWCPMAWHRSQEGQRWCGQEQPWGEEWLEAEQLQWGLCWVLEGQCGCIGEAENFSLSVKSPLSAMKQMAFRRNNYHDTCWEEIQASPDCSIEIPASSRLLLPNQLLLNVLIGYLLFIILSSLNSATCLHHARHVLYLGTWQWLSETQNLPS